MVLLYFLRQEGGYVSLAYVCLLAGLCKKNCSTDFHEIRWKGGTV